MVIIEKHRRITAPVLIFLAAALITGGCGYFVKTQPESQSAARYEFTRNIAAVDYSEVSFTPWDVEAALSGVEAREELPYTVMIYMNGSDLESENGAATQDLMEMLASGVDTEQINVIIFTGGTYRWHNDAVPARDCVVWRLESGGIKEIARAGLRNMGDAGTLSSFIDFSFRAFPAEKYGFIFWDHGGGSIAGYGHDELFRGSSLTLLEIDYAFYSSGLAQERKLEFLGFDACLMATVEMAVVASEYAEYLIASEDLEPGDGWDYRFLGEFSREPEINGELLGRHVADYYVKYYGYGTTDSITMSVTKLSEAGNIMGAMGALMSRCSESLLEDTNGSFTALAKRRNNTRTFGAGTRRGDDCDMVDVGDMANKLSDIFPGESAALRTALQNAVVYNKHNSMTKLGGLTAYYIFGGRENAENTLRTYESLSMSGEYTAYLRAFADIMNSADQPPSRVSGGGNSEADSGETLDTCLTLWERDGESFRMVGKRGINDTAELWPEIGGRYVCMEKTGESDNGIEYAVPVRINGEDADIIIVKGGEYPEGVIVGSRREDGYIIQKGFDKINDGDEIAFYYKTILSGGNSEETWVLSEAIKITGSPELKWRKPESGEGLYYTAQLIKDVRLSERLLDFQSL